MELKNGYIIMYNAQERVTAEKPNQVYASKSNPSVNDTMLICYNNGSEAVSISQFKLVYSDGTHLFGSVSGIPDETNDINIVIKAGDEIVFGEVISE